VLRLDDNLLHVHYVGFADSDDASVPHDNVRQLTTTPPLDAVLIGEATPVQPTAECSLAPPRLAPGTKTMHLPPTTPPPPPSPSPAPSPLATDRRAAFAKYCLDLLAQERKYNASVRDVIDTYIAPCRAATQRLKAAAASASPSSSTSTSGPGGTQLTSPVAGKHNDMHVLRLDAGVAVHCVWQTDNNVYPCIVRRIVADVCTAAVCECLFEVEYDGFGEFVTVGAALITGGTERCIVPAALVPPPFSSSPPAPPRHPRFTCVLTKPTGLVVVADHITEVLTVHGSASVYNTARIAAGDTDSVIVAGCRIVSMKDGAGVLHHLVGWSPDQVVSFIQQQTGAAIEMMIENPNVVMSETTPPPPALPKKTSGIGDGGGDGVSSGKKSLMGKMRGMTLKRMKGKRGSVNGGDGGVEVVAARAAAAAADADAGIMLSAVDIVTVFGDLDAVLAVSNAFLADLAARVESCIGDGDASDGSGGGAVELRADRSVADVLSKHAAAFTTVYGDYCVKHAAGSVALRVILGDECNGDDVTATDGGGADTSAAGRRTACLKRFRRLVVAADSTAAAMEMQRMLPVTRVARYRVAAAALHRLHTPAHPSFAASADSVAALEATETTIAARAEAQRERDACRDVDKEFSPPGDFHNQSRRLLKRDTLVKQGTSTNRRYTFFLFDDSLVYAGDALIGSKLKLHGRLSIDADFGVEDLSEELLAQTPKGFYIKSAVKSFIVYASSVDEKREWMRLCDERIQAFQTLLVEYTARGGANGKTMRVVDSEDADDAHAKAPPPPIPRKSVPAPAGPPLPPKAPAPMSAPAAPPPAASSAASIGAAPPPPARNAPPLSSPPPARKSAPPAARKVPSGPSVVAAPTMQRASLPKRTVFPQVTSPGSIN
jgi:hypothetical protein